MSFAELAAANRRWTILRLLAGDAGHEAESRLIQQGIAALNRAHDVGLDQIRADLVWLDKRLLIGVTVNDGNIYARLTQRGADVAAGRSRAEGVDRPPLD